MSAGRISGPPESVHHTSFASSLSSRRMASPHSASHVTHQCIYSQSRIYIITLDAKDSGKCHVSFDNFSNQMEGRIVVERVSSKYQHRWHVILSICSSEKYY